jgi:hypothetical protein
MSKRLVCNRSLIERWRSARMTSTNQRVGGIHKEVDYQKLGCAFGSL